MLRLSSLRAMPRWLITIFTIAGIVVVAAFVYIGVLNHRVSRELVNHSWRAPTVVVSVASTRLLRFTDITTPREASTVKKCCKNK